MSKATARSVVVTGVATGSHTSVTSRSTVPFSPTAQAKPDGDVATASSADVVPVPTTCHPSASLIGVVCTVTTDDAKFPFQSAPMRTGPSHAASSTGEQR